MASVVAMMMYSGGILQVLFESFSKGPGGFPYLFIITAKVTTLEPIYGPTFADHGVLGGDQSVLDGATTFEVGLYSILPTDLFNAFAETLCIRYDYMPYSFDFIGSGLGAYGALVVSPINGLPGWPDKPFLYLVQSPLRGINIGWVPSWDDPFLCGEAQGCNTLFLPYGWGY